jgi:hypothetical protein
MHRSKQHRHSILREMLDAESSFREIAKSLTNRNVPTLRGTKWHRQMVSRAINRLPAILKDSL